MLPIDQTEKYFKKYSWYGKHYMYGYPADTYPNFEWIRSLEKRFSYIRENTDLLKTETPTFLIKEVIKWGSSKKRDISPKFDDYVGSYCLSDILSNLIEALDDTEKAFGIAYSIPGFGRTYASKLLRFLDPDRYGALDYQIEKAIGLNIDKKMEILGGKASDKKDQYLAYIELLTHHKQEFNNRYQEKYRVADVEMALFQWSVEYNKNKKKEDSKKNKIDHVV